MASRLHGTSQDIFDEATAIPEMETRLLATVDSVLEQAQRKKEEKEAIKAARASKKSSPSPAEEDEEQLDALAKSDE